MWGTDVKEFGADIVSKTSIYVYCTKKKINDLIFISQDFMNMKKPILKHEKCIYMRNITNSHYDVVNEVQDETV